MEPAYKSLIGKYPKLNHVQRINHLGTLGTGNHIIEVVLDENVGAQKDLVDVVHTLHQVVCVKR